MAKITINPGNLRKNQPGGEHITRIMYDDNEPPKNYIWGKPDGYLYQWNGKKWIKLNEVPNMRPIDIPVPPGSNIYVSKTDLDVKLKNLKVELVSYLTKLINDRDCGDSSEYVIQWVNNNIIPEIRRLQEIDHDQFATKEELNDIDGEIEDINENLSELDDRVTDLEQTRVTKDELNEALADMANSSVLNDLSSRITNLENYDHSQFITADDIDDISSIVI